eukprot:TRINITY_DN46918_c0_g1_i1.p1 TRINITY_DN46918_c0_g1~~TRINITY_DN46918_c0_g1_i1.p1  ORF type:complete len:348 (-),score=45.87 TRINITY_DN46918_c0_g1_i1:27-1070(-)
MAAPTPTTTRALLVAVWGRWWAVALLWWCCSLMVVYTVKHVAHKCMLTFFSNAVVSFSLVVAMAFGEGLELAPLRRQWRPVLAICLLTGLERNMTNASMYKISASLKTALHVFNVLFTFFTAAILGADEAARSCLVRRRCFSRGSRELTGALLLVAGGGSLVAITAFLAVVGTDDARATAHGMVIQLASGLVHAARNTAAKIVLGDGASSGMPRPSKFQIAVVAFPTTGFSALGFLPFFESSWEAPDLRPVLWLGVCAVGILLCELRLTELTSPVTVSVLSVSNNIITVFAFLLRDGEVMNGVELAGFLLSSLGALAYGFSKRAAVKASVDLPVKLPPSLTRGDPTV